MVHPVREVSQGADLVRCDDSPSAKYDTSFGVSGTSNKPPADVTLTSLNHKNHHRQLFKRMMRPSQIPDSPDDSKVALFRHAIGLRKIKKTDGILATLVSVVAISSYTSWLGLIIKRLSENRYSLAFSCSMAASLVIPGAVIVAFLAFGAWKLFFLPPEYQPLDTTDGSDLETSVSNTETIELRGAVPIFSEAGISVGASHEPITTTTPYQHPSKGATALPSVQTAIGHRLVKRMEAPRSGPALEIEAPATGNQIQAPPRTRRRRVHLKYGTLATGAFISLTGGLYYMFDLLAEERWNPAFTLTLAVGTSGLLMASIALPSLWIWKAYLEPRIMRTETLLDQRLARLPFMDSEAGRDGGMALLDPERPDPLQLSHDTAVQNNGRTFGYREAGISRLTSSTGRHGPSAEPAIAGNNHSRLRPS